ncbi:MAG TPA: FAD-dependent oxidoreductase [Solirubrobacteraceae bacterium]
MTDTLVKRRGFLAGAGAGALAGTLPQTAEAATTKKKRTKRVDVCVIGAGLAGLTAARELRKRGLRVHVVEADKRVGGRIWTVETKSGTTANFGATFIGPGQDKIAALARELGVKSHPTYNDGQNVLFFNGQRQTYTGTIPPIDPAALAEGALLIEQINGMAQQLEAGAPWKHPRAREWDAQSFETFKLANARTAGARKLMDLVIEALFSVESPEISLLYVLFYIKSAGNLNLLVDTAGGAQERQFTGGSQQICEKLAAGLGKGAVTLRSPARLVRTKGARTTVVSDRIDVSCRRVVVAVPPTMVNRIAFEPGLAAMKDQLYQRMPFGSIGKGIAIYDEPWWRKKGLTGQATADVGPMKATFDLTPPSGKPGVLMGFVDARDAREFSTWSRAERRARCVEQFVTYFGEEARNPKEFLDVLFDEEVWHRGCPVCFTAPGVLTAYGEQIHRRDGARHFATTETATVWAGYMDGAVQAGQDVAETIAKELS